MSMQPFDQDINYDDDSIGVIVQRIDNGAELDILSDTDKINYIVVSLRDLKKFMSEMTTSLASNPMAKMMGLKMFGGK